MKIGDIITINKNKGEVILIQDGMVLIKFNFGQFCFSVNTIKEDQILSVNSQ